MTEPQSTCPACPLLKSARKFLAQVTPASQRAFSTTKYDFHAGYTKACFDLARRIERADKEQADQSGDELPGG